MTNAGDFFTIIDILGKDVDILTQDKETVLQLEYMEKCRKLLTERYGEGHMPTYHLFTSGCQMNVLQSESVAAWMDRRFTAIWVL